MLNGELRLHGLAEVIARLRNDCLDFVCPGVYGNITVICLVLRRLQFIGICHSPVPSVARDVGYAGGSAAGPALQGDSWRNVRFVDGHGHIFRGLGIVIGFCRRHGDCRVSGFLNRQLPCRLVYSHGIAARNCVAQCAAARCRGYAGADAYARVAIGNGHVGGGNRLRPLGADRETHIRRRVRAAVIGHGDACGVRSL